MNSQEIHTQLYITHDDRELLGKLVDALDGSALSEDATRELALEFNPGAEKLVEELFSNQSVESFDFNEGVDEEGEYCVLHLNQTDWGDTNMVHFIDFLYALIPGIHAQAWGYTEEDPWEFFIKYEDGRAIKQEHVPWEDEQMDENAIEYIYHWWHEDLPEEIEAGLLSVESDEHEDDEDDDDFDDYEYDDDYD